MSDSAVHPVDENCHCPDRCAGPATRAGDVCRAVAVPLIVGRALKLTPEQVTMLIQADLFCCGIVTLIQSLGATQWFGIRLPVMMG